MAKNDNLSGFAVDTAEKTGVDRRTVEREAARGEGIPDDVLVASVRAGSRSLTGNVAGEVAGRGNWDAYAYPVSIHAPRGERR